jgi:hypothetical protein
MVNNSVNSVFEAPLRLSGGIMLPDGTSVSSPRSRNIDTRPGLETSFVPIAHLSAAGVEQ